MAVMGKMRVYCHDCSEAVAVNSRSPSESLRAAGWHRANDQTYCPLCAMLRGLSDPDPAQPAAPALAAQGSGLAAGAPGSAVKTDGRDIGRDVDEIKVKVSPNAASAPAVTEIYLPAARRHALMWFSPIAIALLALASWLASLVLKYGHVPNVAGSLWLGGSALASAFTTRLALRGAKCRVTADDSGLVVHNLRNDLRVNWADVAGLDVTRDTYGLPELPNQSPTFIAKVTLRDGSAHLIDATRRSGWRRSSAKRREAVAQCVESLRSLSPDASMRAAPASEIEPFRQVSPPTFLFLGVFIITSLVAIACSPTRLHALTPVLWASVLLIAGVVSAIRNPS
jgi:hypothetical protein